MRRTYSSLAITVVVVTASMGGCKQKNGGASETGDAGASTIEVEGSAKAVRFRGLVVGVQPLEHIERDVFVVATRSQAPLRLRPTTPTWRLIRAHSIACPAEYHGGDRVMQVRTPQLQSVAPFHRDARTSLVYVPSGSTRSRTRNDSASLEQSAPVLPPESRWSGQHARRSAALRRASALGIERRRAHRSSGRKGAPSMASRAVP
jgi:hypothetical protein